MDQAHIQLLAERYRRMPDEALMSLQREQDSLTEEARQALAAVITERPSIKSPAAETAEEATGDAESRKKRPLIGVWLGLLAFGLCVLPFRYAWDMWNQIWNLEWQQPILLEQRAWQIYKPFAACLCIAMFIAAGVALHAIYTRRTRQHLWRIVAAIWFMSLGVFVFDVAITMALYGFEIAYGTFADSDIMSGLGVSVLLASLWTAYLLQSERCRMLFPKNTGDSAAAPLD